MALMRDVFPIDFDSRGLPTRRGRARRRSSSCSSLGLLAEGDRVLITSGDHMELHGATNTLRLLEVGAGGAARRAWASSDGRPPAIPLKHWRKVGGPAALGYNSGSHSSRDTA